MTSDLIKFYAVLELLEANSGLLQKVIGSRDTMNNQEEKGSLYRLQNVNNLPKDYIHMYVLDLPISPRVVQLIGLVELQEYIYWNL